MVALAVAQAASVALMALVLVASKISFLASLAVARLVIQTLRVKEMISSIG